MDRSQNEVIQDEEWQPRDEKYEYLIRDVLPTGRVSLLVGPSGAGKTTLFLQWAGAWLAGEPILDKETYRPRVHVTDTCDERKHCERDDHHKPGTILYVAADRGTTDTEETLDRVLGSDSLLLRDKKSGFGWTSILDRQFTTAQFYTLLDGYPAVKILFVEGVAPLIEGGRISDNAAVAGFLRQANAVADERNISIMFSVHSPKMKRGEEYKDPRQRILGAVAWGGYSSTVMVLSVDAPDVVSDTGRTLMVLPRNYPGREYHFKMTAQGRLVEAAAPELVVERINLLNAMTPDQLYSRQQLIAIGNTLNFSTRTIDRHLATFVERGDIVRAPNSDSTNWRERSYVRVAAASPIALPADTAPSLGKP